MRWTGPYRVLNKLSAVTFRIQQTPHSIQKVVHYDTLSLLLLDLPTYHDLVEDLDNNDHMEWLDQLSEVSEAPLPEEDSSPLIYIILILIYIHVMHFITYILYSFVNHLGIFFVCEDFN